MEQFKKKYIEEAFDLISELERSLFVLEKDFNNKDVIESIFRVMHSLKGGSAMFGFDMIDNYTHHLESIYDNVRNNKLQLDEHILSITFDSVDHLKALLNEENTSNEDFQFIHQQKVALLKSISEKVNPATNNSNHY